jgi:hypothetical protein
MKQLILVLIMSMFLVLPIPADNSGGNISEMKQFMPLDIVSLYMEPDSYLGQTIVMKGIISASYPTEHMFILSDSMGCASCQAAQKDTKSLKVIYTGKIPDKRVVVLVSGKLTKGEDNTFSMNATSVKI